MRMHLKGNKERYISLIQQITPSFALHLVAEAKTMRRTEAHLSTSRMKQPYEDLDSTFYTKKMSSRRTAISPITRTTNQVSKDSNSTFL